MYHHAEGPPLGAFTTAYTGVALVTLGTVLTLSVVLVACSFFRKFRSGTNDSSSQTTPGIYVAESYANPAFLELPFDGSCTSSADVAYELSVPSAVSIHPTTNRNTSAPSLSVSGTSPKSVVAKATGPIPYQEEPGYYVQGNIHAVLPQNGVPSAISHEENRTLSEDVVGDFPRPHEQVSTDIVYANQGAEESFKRTQSGDDGSGSNNTLQTGNDSTRTSECRPHAVIHDERNSTDVIKNNNVLSEPSDLKASGKRENGHYQGGEIGTIPGEQKPREQNLGIGMQRMESEDIGNMGASAKRVRVSLDSLITQRVNGTNQQQRKKSKMSPESDLAAVPRRQSPGKNRVRRKGSKNSFNKVRQVVFHPRKEASSKKQPKVQSAAEEAVIQNPFVS